MWAREWVAFREPLAAPLALKLPFNVRPPLNAFYGGMRQLHDYLSTLENLLYDLYHILLHKNATDEQAHNRNTASCSRAF